MNTVRMVLSGRRSTAGGRTARRPALWTVAVLAVTALTTALTMVVPGTSGAAIHMAAPAAPHTVDSGPAYDWLQFGNNPSHRGVAANSGITTAGAAALGVRWAANLHSPTISSPIVAFHQPIGMAVYVGTQNGYLLAYSVTTGKLLWGRDLGSRILASPVGADNAVWTETDNPPRLYKLNPVTGATECSLVAADKFEASLTAVTPPGGVESIYGSELDNGTSSGPTFAVAASDCKLEWQFTGYTGVAGSWSPVAYGVDANNTPLVLAGTDNPNDTEYAVNALTGKKVWSFAGPGHGDYDFGAGATVSPPGVNGFADGVAYVPSKYGILYALDLTTGARLWSYTFNPPNASTATETGRSTPALEGTNLVFGHLGGVDDLNALTGKLVWSYADPSGTEVISTVAVAGSVGHQVVVSADLSGAVHVLSLATGADLYNYQTGSYIVSAPAVTGNDILISSADGLLYDLAVGGGNDAALPSATITSPRAGATIANPNGNLTVAGAASDSLGVAAVDVSIEAGGTGGPYWNASARAWVATPVDNPATVSRADATTTAWTTSFAVPTYGGVFTATATTHSLGGQAKPGVRSVTFTVNQRRSGPRLILSKGSVARGSAVGVSGAGFAAGQPVKLSITGTTFATVTPTAKGTFGAVKLSLPAGNVFGETSIVATSASRSASLPITVTDEWAGAGGGATNSGYEPDDTSFYLVSYIGSNTGIGRAWDLSTDHAISAGAAAAGGVTYVGNDIGQITALDTQTGDALWTWSEPGQSAVTGSIAVDPHHNLLVATTADGSLHAISTGGKKLWTVDVGGTLGSPTVFDGDVLVPSSAGSVTALSETTGAQIWTTTMGAPLSDGLAIDASTHLLFVGEANRTVIALSTTNGKRVWASDVGSRLSGAPAVSGNTVYVATTGGTVAAIVAASGAVSWTYSAPGPLATSPAVTPSGIYAATGAGTIVDLSPVGKPYYGLALGCTPVGLASASGPVFVTCGDGEVLAVQIWGEVVWDYQTNGAMTTPPAVVDGTVIAGNTNDVYAFTPYGAPPDQALALRGGSLPVLAARTMPASSRMPAGMADTGIWP